MSTEVAERPVTAESFIHDAESILARLNEAQEREERALLEARELIRKLTADGHKTFDRYWNEMTEMTKFVTACLDPECGDENVPHLNRREVQDLIDLMRFAKGGRDA